MDDLAVIRLAMMENIRPRIAQEGSWEKGINRERRHCRCREYAGLSEVDFVQHP